MADTNEITIKYKPGQIFAQLHAVMSEIGSIKKEKSGQGISYKFRGIDQVYENLQPLLIKHQVIILPTQTTNIQYSEAETKSGGVLNYCRLVQVYTFFSCSDDSWVAAELPGEAMDSSDKSTNKALSAAFKYLSFQGFCIPVTDADDADGSYHDLKPRSQYSGSAKHETLPPCPKCGMTLRASKQNAGAFYCWLRADPPGCGYDSIRDGERSVDTETGEVLLGKSAGAPSLADPASVAGSKTASATTAKDELDLQAYEDMLNLAVGNSFPEALVKLEFEKVRRNGATNKASIARCREKFGKPNLNAVKDIDLTDEVPF